LLHPDYVKDPKISCSLLPPPQFPLPLRKPGLHLLIAHARVLKAGEPFAHQVRAFPAMGKLPLGFTAGINGAGICTDKRCPERPALRCFAARALLFVVFAPGAGTAADGLDLLCHIQIFPAQLNNPEAWAM
jgi:hypothetical protein